MITLDLNIDNKSKKVKIKEDVLFNAILAKHPKMIKQIIKTISPTYKISHPLFTVINNFVDFNSDGYSLYPGLIVRTSYNDFAVLYLDSTIIDNDYMINIIKEYLTDVGDLNLCEVNINLFEVDKKTFFNACKKN